MGTSLLFSGDIAQSRAHLDHAFALYNPVEHRPLATRFGHEVRVSILTYRSWAQWMLGYPEAARRDAEQALTYARRVRPGRRTAVYCSCNTVDPYFRGDYAAANAQADAVVALADEKGTLFWKAMGIMDQGCVLAMTGQVADAIRMIASGITRGGQLEEQHYCRFTYLILQGPTRSLVNSMTLGAALAKR